MTDKLTNGTDRYRTNSTYLLPADDYERKRLWDQHRMLTKAFGDRFILAPIKWQDGDTLLEVGAGGGAWLTDVAQELAAHSTNVKLVGIDIEHRLFPEQLPHNTTYSVASVLDLPESWNDRFAYVHQRLLTAALVKSQWQTAVRELYRVTKPGGWVELHECIIPPGFPEAYGRHPAFDILNALYNMSNYNGNIGKDLAGLLADAGYEDITTFFRRVPIGKWGGELGELTSCTAEGFFRAIKRPALLCGGFGVCRTEEEYDALIDDLVNTWNNVPGHYWDHYVSYARKPVVRTATE